MDDIVTRQHMSPSDAGKILGFTASIIREMVDTGELDGFVRQGLRKKYYVFEDSVMQKAREWGMIADSQGEDSKGGR